MPDEQPAPRSRCNVEHVWREWKESAGVRHVAVTQDRLFQSSKGEQSQVKFNIKDSIQNQLVIAPLLRRMAESPDHPIPCIKDLAKENFC